MDEVQTAVAYMRDMGVTFRYRHRSTGCSHVPEVGTLPRTFKDGIIGRLER